MRRLTPILSKPTGILPRAEVAWEAVSRRIDRNRFDGFELRLQIEGHGGYAEAQWWFAAWPLSKSPLGLIVRLLAPCADCRRFAPAAPTNSFASEKADGEPSAPATMTD
jgi:hypothetical protein